MIVICVVWVWALVLLPASRSYAAPELYSGFTLVDPQKETRTANAWLVVEYGRIAKVGSGPAPRGPFAAVHDMTGLYAVPGMIDAHAHVVTGPFRGKIENGKPVIGLASADKYTRFNAAIRQAVAEENARWDNRGPVSASAELVGVRPAGQTPKESPIVQTAVAVSRALSIEEVLREGSTEASTDSNVPMNLKIPAITISGGGSGSGAHSLNETFDATDSWRGTQRALLLAIALAR